MQSENKTIAKNTLFLYLRTFLSIIVSLYTSRVFLEMIGVEDFGIYSLVGGVVAFFSILRGFLAGSIQRFLNIEIGKGKEGNENKLLCVSKVVNIAIVVVFIIIAETVGLWLVLSKLNIPEGKEMLTMWVYHIAVLTTAVTMMITPYSAYIIAHERMGFYAWITIFEVVFKLVITLLLIWFSDRLIKYSLFLLLLYVCLVLWHYWYCRKKIGMPSFIWYSPKKNREYKEMLSFSVWTFVGNGACILRDQGISIVFNLFYGVILNAAMGIVTQVSNIYSTLFANIQTAFLPQIVQNSSTDKARFSTLLRYCCLASLLLMSFVCIPMIANADFILHLWLGDNVPEYTALFVQLFMIKILIVSPSQGVYSSLVAVGKIREIQLWFTVMSVFTVIGAYIILKYNLSPATAIWLIIIMDTLMYVVRMKYMQKYTGINIKNLLYAIWKPSVLVLLVLVPVAFIISTKEQGWKMFLVSSTILTLLNVIISYISIDKDMRSSLLAFVRNRISR